ncbi:hypothetical protein O6H91_12G045000 [Diphasiastrum complanatum]|uniref:Uncharacterized protein n=3 Tax=Diphasiastrum complanatum TaxID=34168 RepID=A0ACC2C156_DIPCM|nr:hypothetical protein O6H91_12G045000 [Diphasiastrum complanatum]KAJ7535765.1 hypothetical protein O6H91_12G045000 [Diphasiastrum complanatum]KAJ7535766.1 hypothetical protein O6H91_12G045000 [Diphasiastrum complanatum]
MHLMLIVAQLGFAGFEVLARVALVSGVSPFVFAVYRNVIAFAVLAPVSYFFEKTKRPPLTLSIIGQLFILGLIGVFINQVTYFTGLSLTSATFTSAMLNSTPAFTFILAAILRFEKVRRRSIDGQAKILGTTLSVSGAILMTVYKGPALLRTTSHGEPAASIGKFNGLESFHLVAGSLALLVCYLHVFRLRLTSSFRLHSLENTLLHCPLPLVLAFWSGGSNYSRCYFGSKTINMDPQNSRSLHQRFLCRHYRLRISCWYTVLGCPDTQRWTCHSFCISTFGDGDSGDPWFLYPQRNPQPWQSDWCDSCHSRAISCDLGPRGREENKCIESCIC